MSETNHFLTFFVQSQICQIMNDVEINEMTIVTHAQATDVDVSR